jgi:glycosyltransferase involved in cell wall biosynthesis
MPDSMIFVGPLSPEVSGQVVATHDMIGLLEPATVVDVGVDSAVLKVRRYLRAFFAALSQRAAAFYLSVPARRAIGLPIPAVLAARLTGKQILLHHHSYARVARRSRAMAVLVWIAGAEALHLVQGRDVAARMRRLYRLERVATFSNVGHVSVHPSPPRTGPLVFGHLSDLAIEAKGARRALDAFLAIREAIPEARMIVAGPCRGPRAEALVAEAQREGVTWLGPVFGADKQRFFDQVDVFLFPSRYRHETQGIVNLEAMASGAAVVAFDQACIGDDIGDTGGLAVPKGANFTAEAVQFSLRFDRTNARARERFEELLAAHRVERARLRAQLAPAAFAAMRETLC